MKIESDLKLTGTLSHRECATVLAALRIFQAISGDKIGEVAFVEHGTTYTSENLSDLEHFEDDTTPLTAEEIDSLCERINLQQRPPMTAKECGNGHGLLCPKCEGGDRLSISVERWANLFPDGTDDEPGDTEWDDNSKAQCECGWEGTVGQLHTVEIEEPEADEHA